jgi:hypothetical protein
MILDTGLQDRRDLDHVLHELVVERRRHRVETGGGGQLGQRPDVERTFRLDLDTPGGAGLAEQHGPDLLGLAGLVHGPALGLRLAVEARVGVLGVLGPLLAVQDVLDARVEGVQFSVQLLPLALLLAGEVALLISRTVGDRLGLLPDLLAPLAQPLDDLGHEVSFRGCVRWGCCGASWVSPWLARGVVQPTVSRWVSPWRRVGGGTIAPGVVRLNGSNPSGQCAQGPDGGTGNRGSNPQPPAPPSQAYGSLARFSSAMRAAGPNV